MLFDRKSYLEKLVSAEGNGMIKVVTGTRRCGKSFLLFELFRQHLAERGVDADHITMVNLEDRRNQALRDPDALMRYIDQRISVGGKHYVLLDEVQMVSEFEDVLNSYLRLPDVELYVTGSNAKFLSKDVVTEFRGRGWEIKVHPLSFAEYYEVAGGEESEALATYFRYGGLPAVAQMQRPQDKQDYLRSVFETVYLRDVLDRNKLKNEEGLRVLARTLAAGIGSSTNPRRLANTFRSTARLDVTPMTIAKYIDCLQDAFIICEALRYDVKGRRYIGTETKYYFEDIGIRNAVVDFRQLEPTHIMENVVYNELARNGFSVDVGQVECFKRDAEGVLARRKLEIDFVVNRHDERLYVQSAYAMPTSEKEQQEAAPLQGVADGFRKVIIVGDRYASSYTDDGILLVSLYDFLLGRVDLWRRADGA